MATPDIPSLPLSTMIHMINIRLSSTNYLMWHAQLEPLLTSQNFMSFIDGSSTPPSAWRLNDAGTREPNPAYTEWYTRDQLLRLFLVSTLTEESMSVVIGCKSSLDVWTALSRAYSHSSKARELSLKDDLLNAKHGSQSLADYGRRFKGICDQLAAIGRPIDDSDKSHWFLRGLGSEFSNFTAAQLAQDPLSNFPTLLALAQSHELFQKSIEDPPSSRPAFTAVRRGRGRAISGNRGRGFNSSQGRDYSHGGSRERHGYMPPCYFSRQTDHDVFNCQTF